MRQRLLTPVMLALASWFGVDAATAKTSHAGWPTITGRQWINHGDAHRAVVGTRRSDKLLGGHGSDTLRGGGGSDVLWGDHKPGGQPEWQLDRLFGGRGDDFIYASHGRNVIHAGPGQDMVKAHFGRGSIDCGSGRDVLFISRRAMRRYRIRNCEVISHRTLGY